MEEAKPLFDAFSQLQLLQSQGGGATPDLLTTLEALAVETSMDCRHLWCPALEQRLI